MEPISSSVGSQRSATCSTGSSLPVVGKGALEAAIRQRRHKPIFVVDIAVPRDVEPEAADLPDVYLYTIDDLTEIIEENVRSRREAAENAESMVADGADHYLRERRAHHGQALLREFRESAQRIQETELSKALAPIPTPSKRSCRQRMCLFN